MKLFGTSWHYLDRILGRNALTFSFYYTIAGRTGQAIGVVEPVAIGYGDNDDWKHIVCLVEDAARAIMKTKGLTSAEIIIGASANDDALSWEEFHVAVDLERDIDLKQLEQRIAGPPKQAKAPRGLGKRILHYLASGEWTTA